MNPIGKLKGNQLITESDNLVHSLTINLYLGHLVFSYTQLAIYIHIYLNLWFYYGLEVEIVFHHLVFHPSVFLKQKPLSEVNLQL